MKALMVLGLSVFANSAMADFVSDHESLFRDQTLCDSSYADQIKAEARFKTMYAILKQADQQGRTSEVQVEEYGAYTTRLSNSVTGDDCSIIRHGECYSAYCD